MQSVLGEGSLFWFELPLISTQPEEESAATTISLTGTRVLLVDDEVINRSVTKALLESHGCTVIEAEDGKACILQFESDQFDIIIMDVQMPTMDGLETTILIRESEKELGLVETPVLGLTASVMGDIKLDCIAAGMNGYCRKPLKLEGLLEEIDRLIISKNN